MSSYGRNSMRWVFARVVGIIGFIGFVGFMGCSSKPTAEERAAQAAKTYYDHLMAGRYDEFLGGRVGADSLSAAYREQLFTACQQFVAQQAKAHQGVSDIRISNARTDTLANYVSVFLLLCYADSMQEEIVVPMVEHNGRWCMK